MYEIECIDGVVRILTDGEYYYVESGYGTQRFSNYEDAKDWAMNC